jgi:proteasome lid subunit RPN8/RPN11
VKINPDLLAEVLDHASRDYPVEACGVLAGRSEPTQRWVMRNAAHSSRRYQFDPQQQLAVWQELDDRGLEPLIVYHSHPFGRPEPSATDIAEAQPGPLYLIVGMVTGEHVAKLWHIENGAATEEPIT